jgi:hypothetical protein
MAQLARLETRALSPAQYDAALDAASRKAKSLDRIVQEQQLFTQIGPSKHLRIEAWITLAQSYGYAFDVEWTRPIEGGWEARAVVRGPTGEVVGHADAECGTRGDANWTTKPSFQQRSMAQTRAISKALAFQLRWVVVLAGYSATPAEEMVRGDYAGFAPDAATDMEGMGGWVGGGENGLGVCPEHQVGFFKSEKMREPAHKQNDSWCNQRAVLAPRLQEAFVAALLAAGYDPAVDKVRISDEIKAKHGATWGTLTSSQKVSHILSLAVSIDPATGEIQPQGDALDISEDERAAMGMLDASNGEIGPYANGGGHDD